MLMPKITEYEVCTWIKQQSELADLPVVFLTALVEENTKEKVRNSGWDNYISKPFTAKYLLSVIESHVREMSTPIG